MISNFHFFLSYDTENEGDVEQFFGIFPTEAM